MVSGSIDCFFRKFFAKLKEMCFELLLSLCKKKELTKGRELHGDGIVVAQDIDSASFELQVSKGEYQSTRQSDFEEPSGKIGFDEQTYHDDEDFDVDLDDNEEELQGDSLMDKDGQDEEEVPRQDDHPSQ